MKQFLIDLLRELESAVPPPKNCHHVISYAQYGSNESGWEDRLAVQVNRNSVFHCFFLDDDDMRKSPDQIVAGIVALLNEIMPNEQLGVGVGQYTA